MDYEDLYKKIMVNMRELMINKPKSHSTELLRGKLLILQILYENGKGMLPNQFSEMLKVSTARIAVVLNGLETDGYIKRELCEQDHRKTIITLTKKGEEKAINEKKTRKEFVIFILKQLGNEDMISFERITRKLATIFQNEKKKLDLVCKDE